jgi:RHS repeat-associated protein
MIADANGQGRQFNFYYPYGMPSTNESANLDKQPYKFGGKEYETMHGLNLYDFEARPYDPILGRFLTPDPLAEKYPWINPYAYCGNNPINRVDPTGMDWYWDTDKTRQYDPNITSQDQLQEGQTYIGTTDAVKDEKGNVIEDYREDGSIMYSNEADAYGRMWNNTVKYNREEAGVITNDGTLVFPNWKNNTKTSYIQDYNYSFENGKLLDPVTKLKISFSGTIHTHPTLETLPDGTIQHAWMQPSGEDYAYFREHTPNIPFYVITADGVVHGNIQRRPTGSDKVNFGYGKSKTTIGGIVFGNISLKNRKKLNN